MIICETNLQTIIQNVFFEAIIWMIICETNLQTVIQKVFSETTISMIICETNFIIYNICEEFFRNI